MSHPFVGQTLSEKIIKNTVYNIFGRTWGIIVALILTPYIIKHIGVERYGIWAVVNVLTGYLNLLDFGMGTSFVKYISEFYTNKDYEKINNLLNTGFLFYLAFAVFVIILSFFIVKPLLSFFNIPIVLHKEALFVFLIGIVIYGISGILNVFGSVQGGLQRMDVSSKISIAMSAPAIIGTIYFLESGFGLPGLMVNNAIILGISIVVSIIIAFRILPQLKFNPFLSTREMFKKLFNFGYKMQVTRLEGILTFQTDKLLLSHFLGVSLVTFYELGSVIVHKVREIPLLLISAIIPAASELDAKKDGERIYELYLRGTKYLAVVGIPLLALVFLEANLIMLAWMGMGYGKSALVIQILAPCFIINILTGMSISIAIGIGKPEFQMKIGAVQLVLNIVLSIILVIKIGFAGVVIGTLISLSLSSMWFTGIFHTHMKYPLVPFIKRVFLAPLYACVFPFIVVAILNHFIGWLPPSRLPIIGILVAEAAFFLSIYIFTIWKIVYLDEYDRNILKEMNPFKILRMVKANDK